mmetsp:Transcript_6979/g.10507  ORF Transcript_6979/g.10507 Transcript_6979/m.10507 type:complete len:214 (+) Transcript_6979:1307-1948(+)
MASSSVGPMPSFLVTSGNMPMTNSIPAFSFCSFPNSKSKLFISSPDPNTTNSTPSSDGSNFFSSIKRVTTAVELLSFLTLTLCANMIFMAMGRLSYNFNAESTSFSVKSRFSPLASFSFFMSPFLFSSPFSSPGSSILNSTPPSFVLVTLFFTTSFSTISVLLVQDFKSIISFTMYCTGGGSVSYPACALAISSRSMGAVLVVPSFILVCSIW